MVDRNCHYYEFLFDDALRLCTGSGKCMARFIEYDANLNPLDYFDCDAEDYKICKYSLGKLEKYVEGERI